MNKLAAFFLTSLFVVGCSAQSSSFVSTATNTSTFLPQASQTSIPIQTKTIVPPILTIQPAISKTFSSVAIITEASSEGKKCNAVNYLSRSMLKTDGWLLLSSPLKNHPSIFYDMNSQEMINFGGAYKWIDSITSLDLSSVALEVYNPKNQETTLKIINNQAEIITDIPWQDQFAGLSYWLADGSIMIETNGEQPSTLLKLNPHTQLIQRFPPDLPDLDTTPNVQGWFRTGWTIYSPDLRRVFYPRQGNNSQGEYVRDLVLHDLEKKAFIASIDHMFPVVIGGVEQFWTRDSSKLAMRTYTNKILIVHANGQYQEYNLVEARYPGSYIDEIAWSPDGRLLAFWIRPSSADLEDETLGIFDTLTESLITYCIHFPQTKHIVYLPIWSPDSRFLALEHWRDKETTETLILNVESNDVYQFLENFLPVAWLLPPKEQ